MPSQRATALLGTIAALTISAGAAVPAAAASASTGPDFSSDRTANFAAALVSEDVAKALGADPTLVGQRVTPSGLEVTVSAEPTVSQRAAVATVAKNQAATLSAHGISTSAVAVPITFRVVPNSFAALNALTARLTADADTWRAQGISFSSWGPDLDNDVVTLRLQNYSAQAAATLQATYGPLLTVATTSEGARASSRTADSAPWYGADVLSGPAGCTSWFSTISASGAAVSPTAGHCGAGTFTQNGRTFGTVTSRAFGGSMDAELIPVTSNLPEIWSDPTSVYRAITGVATTDTKGVLTCTDGAVDMEVCNVKIGDSNQQVFYKDYNVTIGGLTYAHQTQSLNAFSKGNSGGPVETTSGSASAIAQGMLVAHVDGDFTSGWYLPARAVDSYFNVFVKTA